MYNRDLTQEEIKAICEKFRQAGSNNREEAMQAFADIAEAVELPLRKSVLTGDIVSGIFESMDFTNGASPEFPLDIVAPGSEGDYAAFTIPDHGSLPTRRVEGDYLMIPTYEVGNSIEAPLRVLRKANWNIVQRMLQVLEAGFIRKMNNDGWQTILAAATDRNILINDINASDGQLTPRLISLLTSFMRRNGGGNSGSVGRSKLTDVFCSPEAHMDIRAWGLDLVPDQVRTNIYYADMDDQDLINVYGVRLHALDELGEGQDYQSYYENTLGGSLIGSDKEIVVGLDLQGNDSFVHPVVDELQIFENNTLHPQGLFGLYGRTEIGFAVLDSRRTLLGSI